jgi:predicted dehydrogenase
MYDVARGGGYLAGMLSHDIDWICTMFGDAAEVCADVRTSIPHVTLPGGRSMTVTADDTTCLLMRLSSGAGAEISASVVGAHTAGWRFEAFGTAGTIVAEGGRRRSDVQIGRAADDSLRPWDGAARRPATDPTLPARGATSAILAMALMLEDWRPAFDGKQTPVPSFRDGWRAQAIVEAARESSHGAGWVTMPSLSGGTP